MHSLKVNNFSLQVANKNRLNNVSFSIPSEKKVALVGLNGAGKSSLIKLLVGELKPTQGSVTYYSPSLDFSAPNDLAFKDKLGYQAASMQAISGLSSLEYLQLCCQLKASLKKHSDKVIQNICDDWNLNNLLQSPMSKLSQGNMQKLMIASAFMGEPEFIILDEPTQALDPIEQERFKTNLIALQNHKLCLFSSHHISEAVATADFVVMLHHGQLIALLDLKATDEFWMVTQLNLDEMGKHLSTEFINLNFSNIKNLIKIKGLSHDGWLALINKLSLQDPEIVNLGEAKKALMPLFSLLANESL